MVLSKKLIRKIGSTAQQQQMLRPKMKDLKMHPFMLPIKEEIDYNYFFNSVTKRRRPSLLREITNKMSQMPPGTISFAAGTPNVNTFPFEKIHVKIKDGTEFTIEGSVLEAALQYLPSTGYQPLIKKLKEFQDAVHGPQDWSKRELLVTSGAQEALCSAIEMSLTEGDSVIVPSPMYVGTVDLFKQYLPKFITVPQDKDGLRPDILYEQLERAIHEGHPLPKLIYTNPTACNPTGVNLSNERKKEIYELACEYNFLILEDDPYYFLHFLEENPTSFLSMDTEGRVLRFDSFSKAMSSGLRVGYVTGPIPLLRKIELRLQVTTLHTSALSQILLDLLIKEWGIQKLLKQFEDVRQFYRLKRDSMIMACNKHLKGLAEWNTPDGGMFLWLRIKNLDDTYKFAMEDCVKRNVLIIPGHPCFVWSDRKCSYVRLSFSLPTIEQMDQGCAEIADVIRQLTKGNH